MLIQKGSLSSSEDSNNNLDLAWIEYSQAHTYTQLLAQASYYLMDSRKQLSLIRIPCSTVLLEQRIFGEKIDLYMNT